MNGPSPCILTLTFVKFEGVNPMSFQMLTPIVYFPKVARIFVRLFRSFAMRARRAPTFFSLTFLSPCCSFSRFVAFSFLRRCFFLLSGLSAVPRSLNLI